MLKVWTTWGKCRYDSPSPLTQAKRGRGSCRGHAGGRRSQSYPSIPPQACVQRQQDEQLGFPKSTLVWLGARHQGRVYFKGNAEESVFLWQHPCTWQCVLARLCVFAPSPPCLNIPQHQYLSSLLAKLARSPFVSQWWRVLPQLILMWLDVENIFWHYLHTLRIPAALISSKGPRD